MKALRTGFIAVCCLLSAPDVYADDTEIYLSPSLSGSDAQIMVLIDTSGSMVWCEDEEYNGRYVKACDDVPNRRINQLKEAFTNVVDSLGGGISMGIGRYRQSGSGNGLGTGIGGYVMREVEPLNNLVNTEVLHAVEDEYGDIVEDGAGNLEANGDTIVFPNGGDSAGQVGLFFPAVDVPRYAVIKEAVLEVDPSENAWGPMQLEGAFDVAPLNSAFTALDTVSDRSWSTGYPSGVNDFWDRRSSREAVDVTALVQAATSRAQWCGGQGLALRFRSLPPHNSREIHAYGSRNGNAPRLRVTWGQNENLTVVGGPADGQAYRDQLSCNQGMAYTVGNGNNDVWESTSGQVTLDSSNLQVESSRVAGLRFPSIPFDPRSSQAQPDVIEKAVLRFSGAKGATQQVQERVCPYPWWPSYCRTETVERPDYGNVTLTIRAEAGSGAQFAASNNNVSNRSTGTAVSYSTEGADGTFNGNDVIHEVDVTDIVSDALSSSNWQANGSLVLTVSANKNVRIGAVESGQANGASLIITALSANQANYGERVRDELKRLVNNISPNGGTPLMEAYTEMAKYMMGQSAVFARGEPDAVGFDQNGVYDTPLDSNAGQCSSNHIILMTDGEPTSDSAYGQVTSTTGQTGSCASGLQGGSAEASFACMKQLAGWLYDGTQNSQKSAVQTHTVGFHLDDSTAAQLAEVADAGQGSALTAASATELESALRQIINSISDVNSTVAAPGVAVNQLNRMQHLDQLYYAIFGPELDSRWEGNLKRYRLSLGNNAPQLVDQNGNPAVDPNTGFFMENSQSFWSREVDGPEVEMGGARSLLGDEPRRLFVAGDSNGDDIGSASGTSASSTAISRISNPGDLAKTGYGLDASASDEQRDLLFGKLMTSWGDPLHSEPRLVNYGYLGDIDSARNDPDKQDNVLFVSTNDGMLHALDAKSGKEYFTFMPAEQAVMAATRYSQPPLDADNDRTTYGLDGSWTVWRQPDPDNLTDVDKVYLYGGMRRGGRNYYALDVSNKTTPRWLWRIRGGTGDFVELGQTWSTPTLGQVMLDDKAVPVLIFGGGYSPFDHDVSGQFSGGGDLMGNAIYVVNANTGGLIWKVTSGGSSGGLARDSHSDMKWSIPGGISAVDINFDGFTDYLYAADLAGQVFRVDLDNQNGGASDLVKRVVTLAQLGDGAGGDAGRRRFYEPPAITLGNKNGNWLLRIALGSGYRAHPLDTQADEHFFMIEDTSALADAAPADVIGEGDLLDVTSDASPDESQLANKSGWLIELRGEGEKVLSSPAIIQNTIYFTTYLPDTGSLQQTCTVQSKARLYGISAVDGSPQGLDGNNDGTIQDRYTENPQEGLPSTPQVLILPPPSDGDGGDGGGGGGGGGSACGEGGSLVVLSGTSVHDGGELKGCPLQKTRWYEVDQASGKAAIDGP
ncbi:hypothetical protein MWU49_15900 [Alcanivorax sp. S6407]|uniref:pilus assembly protein n=1 Tax=Alcanivorax sp. S6407 TaxID=2926424 RepID=UPI001FF0EA33|nr:PilC/PilY family type IV pilus protein [Alcanivorax sp. S6407]MCK0155199.1 hypothetical protein [Alcanivorax sp. S6407]